MAIRNIVKEGDDILFKKCRAVEKIDDRIITLLDDMEETMRSRDGVGLAAPQVGVLRRVVLVINDEEETMFFSLEGSMNRSDVDKLISSM